MHQSNVYNWVSTQINGCQNYGFKVIKILVVNYVLLKLEIKKDSIWKVFQKSWLGQKIGCELTANPIK